MSEQKLTYKVQQPYLEETKGNNNPSGHKLING